MAQRGETGTVQSRCDGKMNTNEESDLQLCLCLCLCLGIKFIEQKKPRYLFLSI